MNNKFHANKFVGMNANGTPVRASEVMADEAEASFWLDNEIKAQREDEAMGGDF